MPINFLPWREKTRRRHKRNLFIAWGASLLFGVVLASFAQFMLQQTLIVRAQSIQHLQQKLTSQAKIYPHALVWQQQSNSRAWKHSRKLTQQAQAAIALLQTLPKITPAEIILTSVINNKTLVVTGISADKKILLPFAQHLARKTRHQHLNALETAVNKKGMIEFKLQLTPPENKR